MNSAEEIRSKLIVRDPFISSSGSPSFDRCLVSECAGYTRCEANLGSVWTHPSIRLQPAEENNCWCVSAPAGSFWRGRSTESESCHPSREPLRRSFPQALDRKSTRLNSSHVAISYAVFCLKKKII